MKQCLKWIKTAAVLGAMAAVAACTSSAQKQAEYLKRGKALYQAGKYQKARLEFQNVLQIDPKNAAALLALSRDMEQLKEWKRAVAGYRRVLEVAPDNVEAKLRLARIVLMAGVLDQAEELVKAVGISRPKDPGVLTMEGAIAARRGHAQAAMKDVQAALKQDPSQLDATMLLSSLYVNKGRYDAAASLLEKGAQAHPRDIPLRVALADVYDHQKQTRSAIEQLQEVIRLDPENLAQRVRLARYEDHLGETGAARQVLEQAVSDNARSSRAKLALIEFMAAHHKPDAAQHKLQAYIQQSPDDYALRFGLASLYQTSGQPAKAKAVYQKVIDQDGIGQDGLKARTRLAALIVNDKDMTAEQLARAKALLAQVLKENATDNEALTLRGMIALAERDPETAVTSLRTVQHDQPDSLQAARLLAQAYLLTGDTELAKEQLQRAVKLDPRDLKLRLQLARVLARSQGGRGEAVDQLRAVLKQSPGDGDALKTLFDVQMADKDWEAAIDTAKRVKAALPDNPMGPYLLGLAYQGHKQYQASIKEFRLSLDKEPRALQPLTALVKTYIAQKRTDEALKEIHRILNRAPDNGVAYNLQGEVLMLDHRTKQAAGAFRAAIKRNPKWIIPYRNLAGAYLAHKDTKAAIAAYHQGIKATGGAQPLLFDLASVYDAEGDHDAAMAQYEQALQKDPNSTAAANNLAMMLVTYRHDKASLHKAKTLVQPLAESDNPAYLDTLGWVLYKNGEPAPAVRAFEAAVKKAPKSGLLHYHLGMALYSTGNKDAARRSLQVALNGGEKFYGRDEAKATLDKITGL